MTKGERVRNEGFVQGYVCAISSLVKGHGASTEARELLRALGKVHWKIVEEYDRVVLYEAGLITKRQAQQASDAEGVHD